MPRSTSIGPGTTDHPDVRSPDFVAGGPTGDAGATGSAGGAGVGAGTTGAPTWKPGQSTRLANPGSTSLQAFLTVPTTAVPTWFSTERTRLCTAGRSLVDDRSAPARTDTPRTSAARVIDRSVTARTAVAACVADRAGGVTRVVDATDRTSAAPWRATPLVIGALTVELLVG